MDPKELQLRRLESIRDDLKALTNEIQPLIECLDNEIRLLVNEHLMSDEICSV